jgi:hypothetical protein
MVRRAAEGDVVHDAAGHEGEGAAITSAPVNNDIIIVAWRDTLWRRAASTPKGSVTSVTSVRR